MKRLLLGKFFQDYVHAQIRDLEQMHPEETFVILNDQDDDQDDRPLVEVLDDHPEIWMKILGCDDLEPEHKVSLEQAQAIVAQARKYLPDYSEGTED